MSTVQKLGVVGAGQMGQGIAQVAAQAGLDVIVVDAAPDFAKTGIAKIKKQLDRLVEKTKLEASARDSAMSHLKAGAAHSDLAECDVVVEACPEKEDLKLAIFKSLGEVCKDSAILASNTSSIPIMRLATATSRPAQVIGLHFFNPVPVLPLVELVPSLMTSASTEGRASAFATDVLGKHVIRSKDRAGFVVNALLIPYLLSAIRMLESGFATAADIDAGMVHGCAHPMGPLALADLIGLDTTMAVAESMYYEFKEPLYAPPPLLCRMVEAGLLGRKSGRGFHGYRPAG